MSQDEDWFREADVILCQSEMSKENKFVATLQRTRDKDDIILKQYVNVLKFDVEGKAELVSQINLEDSSKQIQDEKEKKLLEEDISADESKDMAMIYGENVSPIFSFLTRTGQLVVVAATVDPQMKDKEQKDKKESESCQIFEIKNTVKQSEHSVHYLVFNCASEKERDTISKCIAVEKNHSITGRKMTIDYRYESEF